ncbi:DUF6062 family protein [Paludicola sp. MB14-C6]|uniref:DUF6062 family protein n=1 Tax=Paludihabitans sp. MB14-C6 TaxID=3070656 RepID=UPI0027DAF732|nr:DUF6062 family protein [Paludicola sp. MB14-C6]WMJ23048.1 DUF6062 family protein [Paludicola sp. MB14-C6]
MIQSIYTIPIQDVFEPKCGCPICNLQKMLEERCLCYILGDAMMQPDIRQQTNYYGFCSDHLKKMFSRQKKLPLALMLETHLDELEKKHVTNQPRTKKSLPSPAKTCFVCNEINEALNNIINNTIKLYTVDSDFRKLFKEQPFFCFSHYDLLVEKASILLNKKEIIPFMNDISEVTKNYLVNLKNDVHAFSTMFDYRNSKQEITDENILTSLERAITFLSSN